MIKAILFDWGQTLVDSAQGFRAAEKQAQQLIYQDLAVTDHDAFLQHYRRIRTEHHARSKLSRVGIWQEVYWYYCREAEVHKLQQWEQEYWQTVDHHTQVFPEVPSVLQTLARQYSLGLISNTQAQSGMQAHRIQRFPELSACFSSLIIAGEDDIPAKPDVRAFERCLHELQIAPEEAVYVGDDWRNDICGARAAGLHPVWLKHHAVPRHYPEVVCDAPVITSLNELPSLVASGRVSSQID